MVTVAQSIVSGTTVAGLASALVAVDPTTYADLSSLGLSSAAAAKVLVTATVTGATTTVTSSALNTAVNSAVSGGATVTDVVANVAATTAGPGSDTSYAPIVAPMMFMWAAMYAFIIS
jgi:hypothetical protein